MNSKINFRHLASFILSLLSFISLICMHAYSVVEGESYASLLVLNIFLILLEAGLTAYGWIPEYPFTKSVHFGLTSISFVLTLVAFFVLLGGRVSYFAFFVSGDIQGTGLSLFFVLAALFLVILSVLNLVNVILDLKTKENTLNEEN